MANIYQKVRTGGGTDNTLVFGMREAFYRPINVGTWTELRVGFLGTMTSGSSEFNSSSQGGNPLEQVSFSSNTDRIYVGLKDNGANAPGTSGTNFVGMLTGATNGAGLFMANGNGIGEMNTQPGPNGHVRMRSGFGVGTSITEGDSFGSGGKTGIPMSLNTLAESGLTYNFFYGLKIVISNLGLSNQGFSCSVRAVNWTTGIYTYTEGG